MPRTTYTKGDASLWDDSELTKLWDALIHETSPSASPPREESVEPPTGTSSEHASSNHAEESPSTRKRGRAHDAGSDECRSNASTTPWAGLPADVRDLAKSFFKAGFEAGKYAARR